MVSLKQSYQPETNGHQARVSECVRCRADPLNFKRNQDGDLVCLQCGWVHYATPVWIGPARESNNLTSPSYHLVRYAGENPHYRDWMIPARVVQDRAEFMMRCPHCFQDVTVGLIPVKIKNTRRWRVECRKGHVIFVAPDSDGVPERWWI